MAARRHRSRPRRRGRFGFLYKLLSFLIILTALLIGCVVFFRVNRVEVTGNRRYTAEEIIEASEVELGENLFLVNHPRTAGIIMKKLPYVKNVTPVPVLPDTMELRVTETTAVAALEAEGTWWLVDSSCKLLEQGDETLRAQLPELLGLPLLAPSLGSRMAVDQAYPELQRKLESLKSLLSALEERNMTGGLTGFVDLSASNAIYFGYGDDLTVQVPMNGDFDRWAFSLQRTLETFEQRGEAITGTLDLTYGENQARLLPTRWLPSAAPARPTSEPEPEPSP